MHALVFFAEHETVLLPRLEEAKAANGLVPHFASNQPRRVFRQNTFRSTCQSADSHTAMAAEAHLDFMSGNPQLEVLSGRLSYHRTNVNAAAASCHSAKASLQRAPTAELPGRRGTLLCILSVPAYMVPTDMLQFAAPFKHHMLCVRIVRPCNPVDHSGQARIPAEYAVLLQMANQVRPKCSCHARMRARGHQSRRARRRPKRYCRRQR